MPNGLLELTYGPPAKGRGRWVYVIASGVLTMALRSAAVWWVGRASKNDLDPMNVRIARLVPIGALFVGAVGSTGFVLGSWWAGIKVRHSLMVAVVATTVVAFALMHYAGFVAAGPRINGGTGLQYTFLEFFDATTQGMHFEPKQRTEVPAIFGARSDPADQPTPFGLWGYVVRAVDLAAFVVGALAPLLVLAARTCCNLCERYFTTTLVTVIAACEPGSGRNGRYSAGDDAVAERAGGIVARLNAAADESNTTTALGLLTGLRAGLNSANRSHRRILIDLDRCPQCGQGSLVATLVTRVDSNRNESRRTLTRHAIAPSFGTALSARS